MSTNHRDPSMLDSPLDVASMQASQTIGELIDGMMISNVNFHALEAVRLFERDLRTLAPLAAGNWQVTDRVHLLLQEREQAVDLLSQARRIPAEA